MVYTNTNQPFEFLDTVEPAGWLASSAVDTDLLAMRGPDGYYAYARALMLVDPRSEADAEAEAEFASSQRRIIDVQRDVTEVLAGFSGADHCYCLLADNGVSDIAAFGKSASSVEVAGRRCFLASGPLLRIENWFDDLGLDEADHPTFIWPADRAWYLASDREVRYVAVGCSAAALEALHAARQLVVADWPAGSDGREFMFMH